MKIIELNEMETQRLCAELVERVLHNRAGVPRTFKVHVEGDTLKYKIGEDMWTPSLGHNLHPDSPVEPTTGCRYCGAEGHRPPVDPWSPEGAEERAEQAHEYDHEARPDDDPEPGDRCKDCGETITWMGPSDRDWLHENDPANN